MPAWSRDKAMLTMTSALGDNALVPTSLAAQEAISQPFHFDVQAVSQVGVIEHDTLLNKPACVTLHSAGVPVRYFHGIVSRVSSLGAVRGSGDGDGQPVYLLRLVPRLWFLNQTIDCRIHQDKSATDILKSMFTDAGVTDLSGPPSSSPRDYAVQFNETDLQFATRLMEEEGWFYFFEHTATKHTLVVANQNSSFKDIPDASFHLDGGDGALLSEFNHSAATALGKMKFKDYDPIKPDTLLQNEQPTTLKTGGASARDGFRWPALTRNNGTLTDRTKREMEAAEAAAEIYEGGSRFGGVVPGGKFKLANKQATSIDGSYVVRSATHHASDDTFINQSGTAFYSNSFSCFPVKVSWRQPLATPRPRMTGIHVAVVIGPQNEEIYTDDYARVQVKFPWDHRDEQNPDQKCWARVIQPWAGNGWGAQFIPRVGTEVAVAFVDGDPDRPMVIGGLYNGRDKPIYTKADKTKSGFRSRSSLKGGTSDFNEFTFDDKKGNELVFLHAQKDLKTTVENDQTLTVDNCRIVTVKKDETVEIQNNQTIKVKMDHKLTVTDGNHNVAVSKGDQSVKIDMGNHDMKVAMGNHATDVKMGNVSLKAGLGKIDNEAMQAIEFKVGQSSVKIDQMGVTIKGMMIKIEGTIQTQVKGLITQVNADAMLMLKGSITMIN